MDFAEELRKLDRIERERREAELSRLKETSDQYRDRVSRERDGQMMDRTPKSVAVDLLLDKLL